MEEGNKLPIMGCPHEITVVQSLFLLHCDLNSIRNFALKGI
jgi:hypothetical protein